MLLIGSQVNGLRHDERTRLDALTGNAAHDGLDVLRADLLARFHLDVCLPIPMSTSQATFGLACAHLCRPSAVLKSNLALLSLLHRFLLFV